MTDTEKQALEIPEPFRSLIETMEDDICHLIYLEHEHDRGVLSTDEVKGHLKNLLLQYKEINAKFKKIE